MPAIPRVLHQGLAADKPAADATLNQGWLYYETDTGILQQSWNGVWVQINVPEISNVTVKIAEQVIGAGGVTSIAFNSIPQTFSTLRVEITAAADTAQSPSGLSYNSLLMQINGDATAAHYRDVHAWLAKEAAGGCEQGADSSSASPLVLGVVADPRTQEPNIPGQTVIELPDYASTLFGKTGYVRSTATPATYSLGHVSGPFYWNQTVGITDLVFTLAAGKFVEGSRARLYGIH